MKFLNNNAAESICILNISDPQDIYFCVKNGLDSIGHLKLGPNSVVAIKPNLCAIKTHETGATTDPRVVEGVIKYLKNEYGVKDISIVESDGTQVLADMAFKLLKYEKLAKKLDVKTVNLSKSTCFTKVFPKNAFLKKILIPEVMERTDFFISVPKIKTHGACSFTATLKNQYGCNPYRNKSIYHKRLHDAIVDLNVAFKPDLTVVDGIVSMDGHRGPIDGIPIRMNTLIFGKDPVAVDHLVSRIMGINPGSVTYLVEAERRGIGTFSYKTIDKRVKDLKRKFSISPPKLSNLYGIFRDGS